MAPACSGLDAPSVCAFALSLLGENLSSSCLVSLDITLKL